MKNPTAMELWNLRMIIVPPMLKTHSIAALQKLAKPSAKGRVPITANDMSISNTVRPRIEYLEYAAACCVSRCVVVVFVVYEWVNFQNKLI